jgi:hypothetical protein
MGADAERALSRPAGGRSVKSSLNPETLKIERFYLEDED